jgi:hypothetical protein
MDFNFRQTASGADSTSDSMGTAGYFQRFKLAGGETGHTLPSSVKVKNEWNYTSILPMRLHGIHKENFTVVYLLFYRYSFRVFNIQGGSNMTGTNCDLFTHKSSWSYLNRLVFPYFALVFPSPVSVAPVLTEDEV